MSGSATGSRIAVRRIIVRVVLIAAYIGLTVLVFVMGKGHTILVDNKDAEDGSVQAIDGVMVAVDRQEAIELYSGDRDKAVVMGQVHTVSVEVIADGTKLQKKIRLPIGEEMLLLSVPKLAAGVEPAVVPFVAPQAAAPEEGVDNTNAFTSPGGTGEPTMMPTIEEPAPASQLK
jgi:hypothetical protein